MGASRVAPRRLAARRGWLPDVACASGATGLALVH